MFSERIFFLFFELGLKSVPGSSLYNYSNKALESRQVSDKQVNCFICFKKEYFSIVMSSNCINVPVTD